MDTQQRPGSDAAAAQTGSPAVRVTAADLVQLGRRLEHHRLTRTRIGGKPVNVAQAAKLAGLTRAALGKLEQGTRADRAERPSRPREITLLRLARVYHLDNAERDELLLLAGYDPEEVTSLPWSPQANPHDMTDEQLIYLQGLIAGILDERRRRTTG